MPWRSDFDTDDFVFSRTLTVPSERAAHYASIRTGKLTRVARGVALPTDTWNSLSTAARHRVLLQAIQATYERPLIFAHASAAALWRLPWVGDWPSTAHVVAPRARGGRSGVGLTVHATGAPLATATVNGLSCTNAAQTAADLAATLSFGHAVAIVDAALRNGVPRAEISELLDRLPYSRGSARARRSVQFADGRADRPGESLSRVTMHLAGIPAPQLQVELHGASGRNYVVDFWWPEFRVFGEFDGTFKYTDPEFLRGRSSQQAVIDEKFREDDLRALGRGCARWGWAVAQSVPQLRERLALAGVSPAGFR